METVTEWPEAKVEELLDQVELTSGHHEDGAMACAMDLIAMAVEGKWTDTPACVHLHLSRVVHRINDSKYATDESRRRLVTEAGPLLVGTAGRDKVWAAVVGHLAGGTAGGLVDALSANLRSANLSSADLRSANLRSADLSSANLYSADLSYANLSYANLSSANLRSADLYSADLRYADLRSADLSSANLRSADLSSANLRSADLYSADLSSANLRSADLSSANLRSANLSSANLSSAESDERTIWPEGFDPKTGGA